MCTPRADLDAAAQVAVTVADTAKYVPSAMEVEPWQIYVGTGAFSSTPHETFWAPTVVRTAV